MSYADTTGFDRGFWLLGKCTELQIPWSEVQVLDTTRWRTGCVFSFFFSCQHLCKSVSVFQANTCANLSMSSKPTLGQICQCLSVFQANICVTLTVSSKPTFVQICQCLPSQHLCKSVSIFQAKTCADLSASFKPTFVQICQHPPSQHLCKSVSVCITFLCSVHTENVAQVNSFKVQRQITPGNCTNTAFSARTLNINDI